MTNRLSTLRSKTQGVSGDRPPAVTVNPNDPLKPFWDKYNDIDGKVREIDSTLDDILRINDSLRDVEIENKSAAADMRGEMQAKLNSILATSNSIKTEIDALKGEVEDRELEGADIRLEQSHLHVLTNKFASAVTRFTNVQKTIKKKFTTDFVRQCNIATIEITEEDAEKIISQNPDALQQSIYNIQGNGAQMQDVVNTYNQIAARHEDILQIERAMQELLESFVQFAIIVKDQGRQIDNIEANVASATNYVAEGVQNLEEAAQNQKSSRKCLYIVLGIIFLLLVAIVVIIVLVK